MRKIISAAAAAIMLFGAAAQPISVSVAEGAPPKLAADSALIYTRDGGAVCGTGGSITAESLAAEFDGTVTVKSPAGDTLTGDMLVPGGSTVTSADGGTIPVIVSGDANADGEIDLTDAVAILQNIAGWDTEIDADSAKTTASGDVSAADVVTLLRYIAGWDVRLGAQKIVVNEDPVRAASEMAGVELWFDHSTEKLAQTETRSTGKNTYVMYCAKNEYEAANLYIAPDKDLTDLSFSVTPFVNCYGDEVQAEIFTFYYINMDVMRVDPLMPVGSTYKLDVRAGNSQGFLVRAGTTAKTVPGLYEATVSIYAGASEIKRAKVYLHVWDFTLDDADAPETSFGMGRGTIANQFHVTGDAERVQYLYNLYYDFFLENRINTYMLPYDIDSDEADAYLNNPRVRSFVVAGTGYGGTMDRTDEQIRAAYEKLSKDPELFAKGYFYYVDEPFTQDKFDDMKASKEFIEGIYPGGRNMVPLETSEGTGLKGDVIYDLLYKYVDIYCPKVYAYTPEKYRGLEKIFMFLSAEDNAKYGPYTDVIHDLVAKGEKTSWWYFAGNPFEPYVTYHADSMGVRLRIAGWQQKQNDVTGVLYYLVDDYRLQNPYRNVTYTTGDGRVAYGNGILVYPGITFGIDGPIGSIRVDNIRDGLEDYMYFTMIERALGEEKENEFMTKITRDLVDFDPDSDKLYDVRLEMGALLEEIYD